jgi:hypothetical protein
MSLRILLSLVLAAFSFAARAAVLPPEKLLPDSTLLVVTVPDMSKARASFTNMAYGKLWNDPAMKPFADKFMKKFGTDIMEPIEREFGIKFSDYYALAQGQLTFALLRNDSKEKTNEMFSKLILLDTKDQGEKLKLNLAGVKKKWTEGGKQARVEKIRDLEFTTLMTTDEEMSKTWEKLFPKEKKGKDEKAADEPKTGPEKLELTFGQADSLLLVSDSPKAIEKILTRQGGGLIPSLGEQADFTANYNALFRDAPAYVWVNAKTLVDMIVKSAGDSPGDSGNLFAIKPDKVVSALGLNALKTVSFTYRDTPEGAMTQLFISAPEATRRGLFKIFAPDVADAAPPPFVPADAVKFSRWRINVGKGWTQLESMLTEISPAVGGVSKLLFENAGKDKDEKYDLKSELLNNLGNDVTHYEKAPRSNSLADLQSAPSIYLIGSPNADKLAAAVKVGISAFAPTGMKDREFLGRKIYSLEGTPAQGKQPAGKGLHFAASGGYVAFSGDAALLEEFLRSNENKAKPLSATAGLTEASPKVGGTGTGLFGFSNQGEAMKNAFEALRKNPDGLDDLFGGSAASGLGVTGAQPAEQVKKIKEWADFSLLPPYEAVSKYFYFSVYAGSFTPEGFSWKAFSPTPPTLKSN